MKILFKVFILSSFFFAQSQNLTEIEADYELQGYFKNYKQFNLDSLKSKKFRFIINIESSEDYLIQRERDNNVIETIYYITIKFSENKLLKFKKYKIHVFSINENVLGLVNYDEFREKKNYYFNFQALQSIINLHNTFYRKEKSITDFVNEILQDHYFGYSCGLAAISYEVPQYEDYSFDNKENLAVFRNWSRSFNLELQTFGVKGLEYLAQHTDVKLSKIDFKVIQNVKKRNSIIQTCSGCILGINDTVFNKKNAF